MLPIVGHACFWASIATSLGWVGFNESYARQDWHVSLIAGIIIIICGIGARYAFTDEV
jgi:membrane protein DedA with SNARE-associated domain